MGIYGIGYHVSIVESVRNQFTFINQRSNHFLFFFEMANLFTSENARSNNRGMEKRNTNTVPQTDF